MCGNVRNMPNAPEPQPAVPVSFPATLGELFEVAGYNRLVGRVLGELMLAEPPYLSTEQLCARIGTSKGHLSSAIALLEAVKMIDRFGMPGSRQHHYRLRDDADIADRACAEVPEGSRAHEHLTQLRDFYRFLARRFPELVAEFQAGAR